ncbi:Ig-like domain-containing protein [Chloroflexota bacterium]
MKQTIRIILIFSLSVLMLGIFTSPSPILAEALLIYTKSPVANALNVVKISNIEVQFSSSINSGSINENTFNVDGSLSGKVAGSYSGGGTSNITFNPISDFKAGETVTITLTTGIMGENGTALANPVTWQFVVDVPQGSANFNDSEQVIGSSNSYKVCLGDVDDDGDLDAFVANFGQGDEGWVNNDANFGQGNKVWLNNGSGSFTDSGQTLGNSTSKGISMGDVDGDGDIDAFLINQNQAHRVWLNDSSGNFIDDLQLLGSSDISSWRWSIGVCLGDVDGDGDLDAFIANSNNLANRVWLNDGTGNFSDSGQSLASAYSFDVSLGDIDGDGDLDAFVANANIWDLVVASSGEGNRVWLNDGTGNFSDSGQSLGNSFSFGRSW